MLDVDVCAFKTTDGGNSVEGKMVISGCEGKLKVGMGIEGILTGTRGSVGRLKVGMGIEGVLTGTRGSVGS